MKSNLSSFDAKHTKIDSVNSNSAFLLEKQAKMYAKVQNSVQQKKWLSTSMMNQNDLARQNSNKKAKLRMIILKEIVRNIFRLHFI